LRVFQLVYTGCPRAIRCGQGRPQLLRVR
jgi:hypothetical protein